MRATTTAPPSTRLPRCSTSAGARPGSRPRAVRRALARGRRATLGWPDPPVGTREASFRAHWDELRAHLDGLYINFESDQRPERLADAYPGETLTRLRRLKTAYDPDNVFNQNFPIPPGVP